MDYFLSHKVLLISTCPIDQSEHLGVSYKYIRLCFPMEHGMLEAVPMLYTMTMSAWELQRKSRIVVATFSDSTYR